MCYCTTPVSTTSILCHYITVPQHYTTLPHTLHQHYYTALHTALHTARHHTASHTHTHTAHTTLHCTSHCTTHCTTNCTTQCTTHYTTLHHHTLHYTTPPHTHCTLLSERALREGVVGVPALQRHVLIQRIPPPLREVRHWHWHLLHGCQLQRGA
jgi:hypothetical protein